MGGEAKYSGETALARATLYAIDEGSRQDKRRRRRDRHLPYIENMVSISAQASRASSLSPLSSPSPMDAPPDAAPNSLGLDLDTLRIKDELETSGSFEPPPDAADETNAPKAEEIDSSDAAETAAETPVAEDEAKSPTSDGGKREREKKQPYVNPERVKTGGAQRVCI